MSGDAQDDISRAKKANYRSSGRGDGMHRSVYVDAAGDNENDGAGKGSKRLLGFIIALLIVGLITAGVVWYWM